MAIFTTISNKEDGIGAMKTSISNSVTKITSPTTIPYHLEHSSSSTSETTAPILEKLLQDLSSVTHSNEFNLENETSMEDPDRLLCLHFGISHEIDIKLDHIENKGETCKRTWDGLMCWPETPEGYAATLPCFSQLNGIHYDVSRNVTRMCEDGGVWENVTNYTACVPLATTQVPDEGLGVTIHVYFFGYCLSLTALLIAMIIFICFKCQRPVCSDFQMKDPWASYFLPEHEKQLIKTRGMMIELRCLRNKIHTNLMVTYILAGALWIITNFITAAQKGTSVSSRVSCITFILLHYFHLTNFFMMFVEGLYLYVLVVQTFMAENIKLRVYAAIGWGIPFLIMIVWSITKWMTQQPTSIEAMAVVGGDVDPEFLVPCVIGVAEDVYDWIYKAPVFLCLSANVIFLVRIMWVLITKLRSATSPETQQSRKAAKALLVLMPLLGITYVFILTGPKKLPSYEHLRALLISTQGFLVALLYCFLNGEVRIALRHRWNRLSFCDGGESPGGSKKGCCSKMLNYICCFCCPCCWNKTEGRRRHNQSAHHAHRKRTSSSSEATTMSTFSFNGRTSINSLPYLQPPNPTAAKRLSMLSTSPGYQIPVNDNIHI